jgi:hypothetical protein
MKMVLATLIGLMLAVDFAGIRTEIRNIPAAGTRARD